MKVYEIKRDGITILLANDEEPKPGDEVISEYEVDVTPQEVTGLEDGDYYLHFENGEWTLQRREE